jgi:hypothetical protein
MSSSAERATGAMRISCKREFTMNRLIATLSVLLLCLCSSGAYAQVPRVLGVWKLNLAASTVPARAGLKSEIRSYTQRDDGYIVVLAIRVYGNGIPDFIQITMKSDGKDYAQFQSGPLADLQISGQATPFTYSETIRDADTAEVVGRLDGKVINKGTRRISKDGKSMTLNATSIGPDGRETPIVLVFDKSE